MNDLHTLFLSELEGIYDGAQQVLEALPEMERDAVSPQVKRIFAEGKNQMTSHIQRLEHAFDSVGQSPERKSCRGIQGIISEGQMLAKELEGQSAVDWALIAVAEKCAHYAISVYGTLGSWTEELGHNQALGLLKQNLGEAKRSETELVRLTKSVQTAQSKEDRELRRLFVRQLRQLFDGENLLVSALGEVKFYAVSRLLKFAVGHHLSQTKKHVQRLEKAFSELGETADRRPCDGIEGIVGDAQVAVLEFLGNSALDAALIAAAQKAEHYEISAYRNLCRWAAHLGHKRVLSLLEDNLSDEVSTDSKLTILAELLRNPKAKKDESPRTTLETAEFLKLATHGR